MNKKELIAAMAAASGESQATCDRVLDAFIDTVGKSLAKREPVALVGFGTFTAKRRAERQGRNPATGEPMVVKAKTSPTFKAGKTLKDKLA